MNKLNKKIISFVLLFSICLLVNVSFAEFSTTDYLSSSSTFDSSSVPSSDLYCGYTLEEIRSICSTYVTNGYELSSNASEYNTMLQAITDGGYKFILFGSIDGFFWIGQWSDTGLTTLEKPSSNLITYFSRNDYFICWNSGTTYLKRTCKVAGIQVNSIPIYNNNQVNFSCKELINNSSGYLWTGQYLISFQPPTDEPTMPTNAEIAQAVQAFYNSDYYKNNKDFKDFIVMYNYNNQYFSFIGHNNEDKFQQLIFPAGYKYDQQWWKFGLDGLIDTASSYLFNKRYWLYSSNDFGESILYNGEGYMKDLLELRFSTSSIIVYSSNDYDVIYYTYNENNELTNEIETIPGDQYTYDENLDPTTNEYNPLENFVPTNPSQTILGNVDFNEINKTFEENKDILNIENASWLFTANNKLVGYFIGFLSLLIVFLIISRILGG